MTMVTFRAEVFEKIATQLDTISITDAYTSVTIGTVDPFEGSIYARSPLVHIQLYDDPESIDIGIGYHKNLARVLNINVHASLHGTLKTFTKLGITREPEDRDLPKYSAEVIAAHLLEVMLSTALHDDLKLIHTTVDNINSIYTSAFPFEEGTLVEVIMKVTVTGLSID